MDIQFGSQSFHKRPCRRIVNGEYPLFYHAPGRAESMARRSSPVKAETARMISLLPPPVLPDVFRPGDGRPCDAGDGDVVDESRRPPEDLPGPLGIGRRGDEREECKPLWIGVLPEFTGLLGGEIDDEEDVDGCGRRR